MRIVKRSVEFLYFHDLIHNFNHIKDKSDAVSLLILYYINLNWLSNILKKIFEVHTAFSPHLHINFFRVKAIYSGIN